MDTLQLIADARIIPTIKLTRTEDAPPLFAALCSGGMTAALVTIRTDDAYNILRQGSRLFPDLLLGADGISARHEAEAAIRSGARIIATSGYSPEISAVCSELDAFYLPFCLSPSELLAHQMQDGKAAGIFSPEAFGRISAVEALSAAFPRLPLIAGNIPIVDLPTYLSLSGVIACTCAEITEGSLDEIIEKCRRARLSINNI